MSVAKTTNFMLSSADLMLGPELDVFDLNPTDHSIGLIKDFTLSLRPSSVKLPTGLTASPRKTVRKQGTLNVSMEVYEYTADNVSYAAGLSKPAIKTFVASLTSEALEDATTLNVSTTNGVADGDTILIFTENGSYSREVESFTSNQITIIKPIGFSLPASTVCTSSNVISVGPVDDIKTFSCRVYAKLANDTPVEMLFPKVSVVSELILAFSTTEYGSIPLQLECFETLPGDPHHDHFGRDPGQIIISTHNDSQLSSGLGIEFWDNQTAWDNLTLWS